MEPVVVSPRNVDRPIPADDLAERQTEGGVKHGRFDADVFQKIDPAVGADFIERARLEVMQVGGVKMIERRKRIKKTMGLVLVAVRLAA